MIKKECLQKVFVLLHLSLCSSISQVSNKQKRKRNAIANWSNLPLVGDQIKSYGSFLQGYASSYSGRLKFEVFSLHVQLKSTVNGHFLDQKAIVISLIYWSY